jgi:hypothetical protein
VSGWLWILGSIVVPLIVNEMTELAPWLALKTIKTAAWLITDPIERMERRAEWEAALPDVPGKLTKLADALSLLILVVPQTWIRYGIPFGPRARRNSSARALISKNMIRAWTHAGGATSGVAGSHARLYTSDQPWHADEIFDVDCGNPKRAIAFLEQFGRLFETSKYGSPVRRPDAEEWCRIDRGNREKTRHLFGGWNIHWVRHWLDGDIDGDTQEPPSLPRPPDGQCPACLSLSQEDEQPAAEAPSRTIYLSWLQWRL